MKFLLSGASGFLGTALRTRLAEEGHEAIRLVRREPATGTEFRWDPDTGTMDGQALDGIDVVVNLSGAGVADGRWTESRRELILSSRVRSTTTLAKALSAHAQDRSTATGPVLIQASGISVYGTERTVGPCTEDSPAGRDYLSQVVVHWEAAAQPAVEAGLRVVFLRTSPVMDRSGGPLRMMKLPWSLGLGARLGDGSQRMPMVSLDDYLSCALWAATDSRASGPYNLTIPEPCTNAEFTDTLARALRRPRVLGAPAFVVRTVLGELAEQLLGDMYVMPQRLNEHGFVFSSPDVEATVATALAQDSPPPGPA